MRRNVSHTNPDSENTTSALGEPAPNQHGQSEQPAPKQPRQHKYTYADCLCGRVTPPAAGAPGKFFFTMLMVGGMVTFMVTYNGLRHAGWNPAAFYPSHLWMYPLIYVIALLVRTLIADDIVGFVIPRFINNRFSGLPKNIVITLLNITIMCPIMSAIVTLLLYGTADFAWNYLTGLPTIYPIGLIVNFFIVGPAVKLLHTNIIPSAQGMQIMINIQQNLRWITAFFGW